MNDLSKSAPVFSIVTITRNNVKGIQATYASIAAQSEKNFEWVVIDGASTDGTIEFLKTGTSEIQRKNMFSEPDKGIYDAMNKGIKAARGDYIIFLNAGDKLASDKVLAMLARNTEKAPDFMYGDALEGIPPALKSARPHEDMMWGMFTHHQAMIYRRHTIRDKKLRYSTLYEIAGDYDFTARFLRVIKSAVYIPKPICIFEPDGISQQKADTARKEQYLIREALEITSAAMNTWIYLVQTAAWSLKHSSPKLYGFMKNIFAPPARRKP